MALRTCIGSLPLAFGHQVFFLLLGEFTGVPFRELAFTPFGFLVFYFSSFALLMSLR